MKHALFLLLTTFVINFCYAQKSTMNAAYYKVKMGHRNQLYKAMAEHNAKFRPASGPHAIVAFDLTGGEHHGEILIISNIGKSYKDRDNAPPPPPGAQDDMYSTVSPHFEDLTGGDVLVYRSEYSNSPLNERAEKSITTTYYLNNNAGNEFWAVVKKLPAVWDKAGMRIAGYTAATGSPRLFLARRFPNGWAELDDNSTLAKSYDEVHGAGAYEKDIKIFQQGVDKSDRTMLRLNKEISSK